MLANGSAVGVGPYNSTITNHVEYLPITVDIMAAKGCDGLLFALVNELVSQGVLSASETGYSQTTGGQIFFK